MLFFDQCLIIHLRISYTLENKIIAEFIALHYTTRLLELNSLHFISIMQQYRFLDKQFKDFRSIRLSKR